MRPLMKFSSPTVHLAGHSEYHGFNEAHRENAVVFIWARFKGNKYKKAHAHSCGYFTLASIVALTVKSGTV